MMKSVPPLNEIFDMAGLDLPGYLGTKKVEVQDVIKEVKETVEEVQE